MSKKSNGFIGVGAISAIAASLCCITPVFALISGVSGAASAFSWMEPARPILIGITILVLGFAWYQKLKPRTDDEIQCDCEDKKKQGFWQTKLFLGVVTGFSVLMLAFPSYAHVFYSSNEKKDVAAVNSLAIQTLNIGVHGMTCDTCASHIENSVNRLPGILKVHASDQNASVEVQFDPRKTNPALIEKTISESGYAVSKNVAYGQNAVLRKAGHICGPNGCE